MNIRSHSQQKSLFRKHTHPNLINCKRGQFSLHCGLWSSVHWLNDLAIVMVIMGIDGFFALLKKTTIIMVKIIRYFECNQIFILVFVVVFHFDGVDHHHHHQSFFSIFHRLKKEDSRMMMMTRTKLLINF